MLYQTSEGIKLLNLSNLKGKRLHRYNLAKFRMICAILDYVAQLNGIVQQKNFSKKAVFELLQNNKHIKKTSYGVATANSIFMEMCLMGLIIENGNQFSITEFGIEAYRTQRFHQICASLTASESTRNLGKITLLVSVIAAIIAIISLLCSSSSTIIGYFSSLNLN